MWNSSIKVRLACKSSCLASLRWAWCCQQWAAGCHRCDRHFPFQTAQGWGDRVGRRSSHSGTWDICMAFPKEEFTTLGTWSQIFKMVLAVCCLWKQRVPGCEFPAFPHGWKGVLSVKVLDELFSRIFSSRNLPVGCNTKPSKAEQVQVAQRQIRTRCFWEEHRDRGVTFWDRYNSLR